MKENSKWEVVWSRGEPFIIFRSNRVFKVFKVKVEDDFYIIGAIKTEGGFASKHSVKTILQDKFELDGSACDKILTLYREFFRESLSSW